MLNEGGVPGECRDFELTMIKLRAMGVWSKGRRRRRVARASSSRPPEAGALVPTILEECLDCLRAARLSRAAKPLKLEARFGMRHTSGKAVLPLIVFCRPAQGDREQFARTLHGGGLLSRSRTIHNLVYAVRLRPWMWSLSYERLSAGAPSGDR